MAAKQSSSIVFVTQSDSFVLAFASNGRAMRVRTLDGTGGVVPALFTPFPVGDVIRWETRTERGCTDAIRAYLKNGECYACLPGMVSIDPLDVGAYWTRVEAVHLGLLLDVAEQDRQLSALLNSRESHHTSKVDRVKAEKVEQAKQRIQATKRAEQEADRAIRLASEKAAPELSRLEALRAGLGLGS